MKQTNNAIKFLMAQYRAIYQSAYLKGLASAIIVTASLAAGQAQAATTNFDKATSGGTITISQDSDVLEITTAITSKDNLPFNVKISTGKGIVNKVEGVAASANKATFEINGTDDTTLQVAASKGGTAAAGSLTIGTLDVKKGSVTVDADAKDASLFADQVNVASGGKITASSTGAGKASLGNKTTKYKLDSGSTIILNSSGAMLGQDLVSTGGKIVLNSGSYHTPTTSAQKLDFVVEATSSITLPSSGDNLGTLNLASGSTIDIKAAATGGTANELKITGNGTKGSIVVLQDGVSLKSSGSTTNTVGGVISVSGAVASGVGGTASNSELHLTAKTLGEFLKPTDTTNNASGSILLNANSTLKFTNDSSVDIAASGTNSDGSEIKIASGTAGAAGQVVVNGATTIDGKKITISKAMASGLNTNLNVTADELTLGSSSANITGSLGVASLSAKNVKFVGSGSSTFVLADKLTLSNLADDATDPAKKVAQKGTIAGPVIISGTGTKAITVDGGLYTSTGDITISGGAVKIHNTNDRADQSSLTADGGNWILDRDAQDGKITVSGTGTLLDLSKATVKYKENPATTTHNVKFEAHSGGEIKLKGEDIAFLLDDGSKSGAVFDIGSGSQLTAAGDLTLKAALIKTTAATTGRNSDIFLDNGATLAAEGTLELQKFDKTNGLTLAGKDATLQAGTLKLTLADTDASGNSAILQTGHYVVTAGLDTNAGKGVVVSGANATFDFGGLKKDTNNKYTALSSGGSTDEAIVVSGAKMNVNAGTWNLTGKLTLNGSSPSLTVGNADTVLTSADSTIAATLNASELVIEAGSATVEKTGTLSVSKIDAIGSAINVSGTMSLAGAYNESGADTDAYAKYGIKLADDAITVHEGASLTLKGSGVEKALGEEKTGDKITNFKINTNAFNASGSLVSEAGSTINITYFKDGTVLTKNALQALSKGLFGTNTDSLKGSINLGKVVFEGLQSSGGTVSWTDAKDFGVNYLPHYKNDDLMSAQLINVSGDTVYGHWGSVLDTTKNSGDKVAFADNASLNNAKEVDGKKYFALGKDNAVLGLEIKSGGTLTLANGGIAGDVKIGDKAKLIVDSKSGYTTELESISGGNDATVNLKTGITQVNKNINVGQMSSEAESILNVTGDLKLTNKDDKSGSVFKGIVNVSKDKNKSGGNVVLSGTTLFAGTTNVEGNFTSNKEVTFTGNATIEGLTKFTGKATVEGGGFLKAKDIELTNNTTLYIGRETLKEGSGDKAKYESSTGYLEADRVDLNGGTLFIDPEYGKATSIAVIKRFGKKPTGADTTKDPVDVGTIDGKLIIGQNSALFAGADATVELMKTFIKRYQESTGTSLTKDNGSILYVSDKLTVDKNSRIILDAESHSDAIETELKKKNDGKYAAAYNGTTSKTDADLFLGKGSVLVVGQDTLDEGSAIYFDKKDASILAEGGSKVVLDGDRFISSRDIIIFQDSGNDGVKILGEKGKNDIKVESINGIMGFTMEAGKTTSGGTLALLTDKIDSAYRGASTPMRDYLIGYASLTKNWKEYYSNTDENADSSINPKVDPDYFVERAADKSIATADKDGKITVVDTKNYTASQFVAVKQADGTYQVFFKAYNEFLEKVIRDTNGLAADQAARMGVFGGSADAAMLVGNASYEAVAGRFGMGQQGMLMTYANNGQGGAMWVAPVYKSRETNGFKAQGLEYGTDTSITGLVLGADLTYEDGMRYGVMANIGEGDSSGEGAAKGVSSEYKYYSFGFYAGYNYKAFSMVGDLSYSVVDSDVDANTDAGMVNTSFNTTNLSVGVTGQVNLSYRGLDIVPHAGLRYSMIDMDDYDMNGNGKIGSVSVDKANVMSVPVGVTISKEYFSEEWSFQPSIDLNLTANFGDDKIDGNVKWSGISNADLNTSNEFMDDLTYGVIFGFGAQSERLSIGAGLGYQGSSNVDEFTLTGTARYTF